MISKHIIVRGGAALFAAALAVGATSASASIDPSKAPAPAAKTSVAKSAATTKYCVVDSFTGSRVPRKFCRTRDEWIAQQGIDPLTFKK